MTDRRSFLGAGVIAGVASGVGLGADATQAGSAQAAAAGSEIAAARHERAASLAATTAMTAAGGLYESKAAGLAGTHEGKPFACIGDRADTYAILYRKMDGVAVEQSRYASKAAYEGPDGADLIGMALHGAPRRTVYAEAMDALINVRRYGESVGAPGTIASDAIALACKDCLTTGKPAYFPAIGDRYYIDREQTYPAGIVGDGRGRSIIRVHDSARKAWDTGGSNSAARNGVPGMGRQAAVNLEDTVPVRGFSLEGLSQRPADRTGDRNTQKFSGVGLRYGGTAGGIHATNIGIAGFDKGISHDNDTGHLGGTDVVVSNCWFNLFWEKANGDYRYFDSGLSGALFSSLGCYGDDGKASGTSTNGCFAGIIFVGCHMGFSPFVAFQSDGNGVIGLLALTFINSSVEQVGNQIIRLGRRTAGQRRRSANLLIMVGGHTWTDARGPNPGPEARAYTILDGSYPVQDVAISGLDLVEFGSIDMGTDGWYEGTSGYIAVIEQLRAPVLDRRGPRRWGVGNGADGQRWLVGTGRGYRQGTVVASHPARDASGAAFTLATWDLPYAVDGYAEVDISIGAHLSVDAARAGPQAAAMRVVFNAGEQVIELGEVCIAAGESHFAYAADFMLPRRNRKTGMFRVELQMSRVAFVEVNGRFVGGRPSQAVLKVRNHASDVTDA